MKLIVFFMLMIGSLLSSAQTVVINEVYGAGGNSGAVYTHDFVELFNPTSLPIDLTGWSVQYAAATGTGTWQATLLTGTIEAGKHYLIQLAGNPANGLPLPLADVVGTTNMASTSGKVALVHAVTPLSGACPANATIIDRVGYGASANCFEGTAPSPAPSTVVAIQRSPEGVDSQQNNADFKTSAPSPQHSFPRPQIILFSMAGEHTYGDQSFELSASASSGLAVTFFSDQPTVASVAGNLVTIHAAGTVTLRAVQDGNAQFSPTQATQTIQIGKAVLDVTISPVTRQEGESNPPFVLSYTGFVNGDDEGMLDALPLAASTAEPTSAPGNYPILLTGGQDENYRFNLHDGVLTVTPRLSPPEILPVLKSPNSNSTGVSVTPRLTSTIVPGATVYTFDISTHPDFNILAASATGSRSQVVTGLWPGVQYHVRIRTDLSTVWGPVRTFQTASSLELTALREPREGLTGVSWLPRLVANDVKATEYTFQLSTSPSFTNPITITVNTPEVTVSQSLAFNTIYFCRIQTSLSVGSWGPVHSFTTGHPVDYSVVKSPRQGDQQVPTEVRMTLNYVPGATLYYLSLRHDGAEEVVEQVSRSFVIALLPSTPYEARMRTNLVAAWGPSIFFQTAAHPELSWVIRPANGKEDVLSNPIISVQTLVGASEYTVEINTLEDFTGPSMIKTSTSRSMRFQLEEGKRYYARVRTAMRPDAWGPVTTFTTVVSQVSLASESVLTGRRIQITKDVLVEKEEPPLLSEMNQPYPNPFRVELIVPAATEFRSVSVMDAQGREVESLMLNPGERAGLGQSWVPGVYLIRVNGKLGQQTHRIIKAPR